MEKNLSIIVPHYNSPAYLCRLLDSIPMRDDIEIIVVDDRSTEKLEELEECKKKYESDNIIFITSDSPNKGSGAARNVGIKIAKGKWMIFSDADDVFLEGFEDVLASYFETDNDIVYFPPTSIKENGEKGDRHIEFANYVREYAANPEKYENELKIRYRYMPPWSKMMKTSFLNKNGLLFDERMCSEDVMFACRSAYSAKKVAASDTSVYCIIDNPGSITANTDAFKNKSFTEVSIQRYKYLKERLSKKDFKTLDLAALGRITLTLRSNMSGKDKREQLKMIFDAHMRIIPRKIFTVKFWRERFK